MLCVIFILFVCYLFLYACFIFIVGRSCFKTKKWKYFTLLFWPSLNSTLKVFLQKISVRGNPKYVFKKQTDHDSPQY